MAKEKINHKKQIKLDVKYRIDRGEPKQQILEDLSYVYQDKNFIIRQIESIPSKAMKSKYGLFNYMLASLLLAALVLDVILMFRLEWARVSIYVWWHLIIHFNVVLSLILDSVFLIGVLMYRINIYSWIAARALITLVTLVVSYADSTRITIDNLILVSFGLVLISFVVGLLLCLKLCPPRIPKVIEVDVDGVEKIKKTIYVYPD